MASLSNTESSEAWAHSKNIDVQGLSGLSGFSRNVLDQRSEGGTSHFSCAALDERKQLDTESMLKASQSRSVNSNASDSDKDKDLSDLHRKRRRMLSAKSKFDKKERTEHQQQRALIAGNGRYRIIGKLGKGAFGQVYQGEELETGLGVAIKIERADAPRTYLPYEVRVQRAIRTEAALLIQSQKEFLPPRIPGLLWFGVEGVFNVLVMELCGPCIEELFTYCERCFSMKTLLMLSVQILKCVEAFHLTRFIHRDIKPENFVMGVKRAGHIVFLIDFGLAKRYMHSDGRHTREKNGRGFVGTSRYASINTHQGLSQSRRDDLESVAYTLIYLAKSYLPWMGLPLSQDHAAKRKKIQEVKESTDMVEFCSDLPSCFQKLVVYARSLSFEDEPNYHALVDAFEAERLSRGLENDYIYDWLQFHSDDLSPGYQS